MDAMGHLMQIQILQDVVITLQYIILSFILPNSCYRLPTDPILCRAANVFPLCLHADKHKTVTWEAVTGRTTSTQIQQDAHETLPIVLVIQSQKHAVLNNPARPTGVEESTIGPISVHIAKDHIAGALALLVSTPLGTLGQSTFQ